MHPDESTRKTMVADSNSLLNKKSQFRLSDLIAIIFIRSDYDTIPT
jgi:hypothetical protein